MQIVINSLPKTVEDFVAMPQMDISVPQHTIALFLVALDVFSRDRMLGRQMIELLKGPVMLSAHEESFLYDRIWDKPYLPMAYFEGATPKNNYVPSIPLTVCVYDDYCQNTEKGYIRFLLETAGADSRRAITLRSKDGRWYLWEYAAIVMSIRLPAKADPWL